MVNCLSIAVGVTRDLAPSPSSLLWRQLTCPNQPISEICRSRVSFPEVDDHNSLTSNDYCIL